MIAKHTEFQTKQVTFVPDFSSNFYFCSSTNLYFFYCTLSKITCDIRNKEMLISK